MRTSAGPHEAGELHHEGVGRRRPAPRRWPAGAGGEDDTGTATPWIGSPSIGERRGRITQTGGHEEGVVVVAAARPQFVVAIEDRGASRPASVGTVAAWWRRNGLSGCGARLGGGPPLRGRRRDVAACPRRCGMRWPPTRPRPRWCRARRTGRTSAGASPRPAGPRRPARAGRRHQAAVAGLIGAVASGVMAIGDRHAAWHGGQQRVAVDAGPAAWCGRPAQRTSVSTERQQAVAEHHGTAPGCAPLPPMRRRGHLAVSTLTGGPAGR